MVIAMRGRTLTPKRTEYGKMIRGGYERGEIKEKRSNMQQLEPRNDGCCNTITTVQKDNLVLRKVDRMKLPEEIKEIKDTMSDLESLCELYSEDERIKDENGKTIDDYLYQGSDGEFYGIFKLSAKECGRLMGCTDADIDKMLAVNSRSQCYKQFGNSIVTVVLMAIFSQLNIAGVTPWNELSFEEKLKLRDRTIDWERVEV